MEKVISLDALMNGAVSERVINEINRALENVFDPNTDAKATREVVLTLKMKPNTNRDGAEWRYDTKVKLAPLSSLSQTVFMRKQDDGSVAVFDQNGQLPGQIDINGDENTPNVLQFDDAARK